MIRALIAGAKSLTFDDEQWGIGQKRNRIAVDLPGAIPDASGCAAETAGFARIMKTVRRFHRCQLVVTLGVLFVAFHLAGAPLVCRDGRQTLAMALEPVPPGPSQTSTQADEWRLARLGPGGVPIRIGRNLVLHLDGSHSVADVVGGQSVTVLRSLTPNVWLLRAPSPEAALATAAALSGAPGVVASYPGYRRLHARPAAWSVAPKDPYFGSQSYLDGTTLTAGPTSTGADLVIRSAWAVTKGEGVIVAICDDGLDARHPELSPNLIADLNLNYFTRVPSADHSSNRQYHGTAVAGLVGARDSNGVGIAGVAPRAGLCGWVLFDRADNLLEIEALAELFTSAGDRVSVQNHSWGNADFEPLIISDLEANALSNAATLGRSGRGVVHVRAAGNSRVSDYLGRSGVGEANLDGFANAPWAITVGAVRIDGRVTSYSTAGACLLVSALGGERADRTAPFSLDPVGNDGLNTIANSGVLLADYTYPGHNEAGTSFTSPQIAGLAALLLSARPELSARDVALVLALAARPVAADPVTQTNGAGLLTGDNVGFGVPHAGRAVDLAQRWRPGSNAWALVRQVLTNTKSIPDDGFRVLGYAGDGTLRLDAGASGGSSALVDTRQGRTILNRAFPFRDIGKGEGVVSNDLSGQVALIERRPAPFEDKLNTAAKAGAVAGIIIDDVSSDARTLMLRNEFARIPGAFLTKADGDAFRSLATNDPAATIQFVRRPARFEFAITNPMAVHWVQVRVQMQHSRQGDLRVSLISPAGTVSLLQRPSTVNAGQLEIWAYGSKQFLLEGSVGVWGLEVMDESPLLTGEVSQVELILHGPSLAADTDGDGLADGWELVHFGNLSADPRDDPDGDGLPNAAEQALGLDPLVADADATSLAQELPDRFRLSWPAVSGRRYQVESSDGELSRFSLSGIAIGRSPEGAWIFPSNGAAQLFRVRLLVP